MSAAGHERWGRGDPGQARTLVLPDEMSREQARVAALHGYGLIGRELDPVLEDLVQLATLICDLPMGAINLIDVDLALIGLDGRFLQVNPALALLVGRAEDEVVGAHIADLTHPEDHAGEAQLVSELVEGTRSRYRLEKRYVHRDGRVVWVEAWGSLVRDATGEPAYIVKQVEDIDDRRHIESGLVHQATHDALTGLPNRALLADRLDQALAAQSRSGQLVVCSIDLDGFKAVNDTYGHAAGDALLIEVAERLRAEVRRHDTVCRLGGDEFVIVSHEATVEERHVPSLVERITRAVSQPFLMGVHELMVGLTLGVAVTQRTDQGPDWLLRCSDEAMYRAKHRCRGSVEVVDVDELRDL